MQLATKTEQSAHITAHVLKGVRLVGFHSKNGRDYPAATLKAAVGLYEGIHVNLDHPAKPTGPRSVRDRIGIIRNARFDASRGIVGDFHLNPRHEVAEQILWDSQHNVAAVGFSHNADLVTKAKNGKTIVEQITAVRSVDLVADPATTNGFFEALESFQEGLTPEALRLALMPDRDRRRESGTAATEQTTNVRELTPEYLAKRLRSR